jgi:hypothetical protein
MVTSDLHGGCTGDFGGTSASAPVASGVIALALQANPCLNWRDIQHVIARSSAQNDEGDDDWTINGAGFHINHKYGFGSLDAGAAVSLAQNWRSVATQIKLTTETRRPRLHTPVAETMNLTGCNTLGTSCIDVLEHVSVYVNISTDTRGSVSIWLQCPSGTVSRLLKRRSRDMNPTGIDWEFSTTRCWGESPVGTWTLNVESCTYARLHLSSHSPAMQLGQERFLPGE